MTKINVSKISSSPAIPGLIFLQHYTHNLYAARSNKRKNRSLPRPPPPLSSPLLLFPSSSPHHPYTPTLIYFFFAHTFTLSLQRSTQKCDFFSLFPISAASNKLKTTKKKKTKTKPKLLLTEKAKALDKSPKQEMSASSKAMVLSRCWRTGFHWGLRRGGTSQSQSRPLHFCATARRPIVSRGAALQLGCAASSRSLLAVTRPAGIIVAPANCYSTTYCHDMSMCFLFFFHFFVFLFFIEGDSQRQNGLEEGSGFVGLLLYGFIC